MIACTHSVDRKKIREFGQKTLKFGLQHSTYRVIFPAVRSHPGFATAELMVEFRSCWAGRLRLRSFLPWPPSPDTQGRDEKGSTALPARGPDWCCDCRHPCRSSASRQEPIRAGLARGKLRSISVQGGTPHFESRRRRCEVADRIATIPSVSGGNDAHDTRVDRAANRGHRPRALRLCLNRRQSRCDSRVIAPPERSMPHVDRRGYRRECDQLCPDHDRLSRRRLEHPPGLLPGCRQCQPASRRRITTRRSASPSYPATIDGTMLVNPARSRSPAF